MRVLAALVLAIVIVLGASTVISLSTSQARLRQELLDRGQDELRVLKHTVAVYVAQQNTDRLILAATSVTNGGQPLFLAFYSPQGDLLASSAAPNAPDSACHVFGDALLQAQASGEEQLRWGDDVLEIALPVTYYGQPSGVIAARFGTDSLRADMSRNLTESLITASLLALTLSCTVGLLLRQLIIVPLRRLSAASDQISAGNWIIPTGHQRADEFGTVARSFGQMVQALQAREAQLQEQIVAVQVLNSELDQRVTERTSELQSLVSVQDQLLAQIRMMSIPVVPALEGVIVVPLIGILDGERASQLVQSVLQGVERYHARVVVLDITGASMVDDQAAEAILTTATAARLLGASLFLVGVRPEIAQALVQLNVELSTMQFFATLQQALHLVVARKPAVAARAHGVRRLPGV